MKSEIMTSSTNINLAKGITKFTSSDFSIDVVFPKNVEGRNCSSAPFIHKLQSFNVFENKNTDHL